MHIGPWEIAAYGGLWIGAFILAADVGLRMAPELRKRFGLTGLVGSGYWGFTPLVLLTLSGAIFLADALGWLPARQSLVVPGAWQFITPLILLSIVVAIWVLKRPRQRSATATVVTATPTEAKTPNISSVRLVPSGDDAFSLVITPGCGGVTVGVFLDWSPWHAGATYWDAGAVSAGWATAQRFFLGDLFLRAAGVRDSIRVLERETLPVTRDKIEMWKWKILRADGTPSGTQPVSNSTKERVTFVFIEQHESPEKFHFLLVRAKQDWSAAPIIMTPDDFSWTTEV